MTASITFGRQVSTELRNGERKELPHTKNNCEIEDRCFAQSSARGYGRVHGNVETAEMCVLPLQQPEHGFYAVQRPIAIRPVERAEPERFTRLWFTSHELNPSIMAG
jgi:hypothetical protein